MKVAAYMVVATTFSFINLLLAVCSDRPLQYVVAVLIGLIFGVLLTKISQYKEDAQ